MLVTTEIFILCDHPLNWSFNFLFFRIVQFDLSIISFHGCENNQFDDKTKENIFSIVTFAKNDSNAVINLYIVHVRDL